MKTSVIVLLFALTLSGCAQLWQQQKVPVSPDQLAFEQALATFQETGQLTALEDFIVAYPDSAWAGRAAGMTGYVRDLEQSKEQLQEQLHEQQTTLDEQAQQLKTLRRENKQLAETIDQLKGSLIELEKRPL